MNELTKKNNGRTTRVLSIVIGLLIIILAFSDSYIMGDPEVFGVSRWLACGIGAVMISAYFLPIGIANGLLSTIVSTAFALVLAEIVLNALYAPRFYPSYQLDENHLYELTPGSSMEFRHFDINGGQNIIAAVNSDGYRGEELRSKDDVFRVVVYGDSFIHSFFSTLENTFTEKLEKILSIHLNREVEVINAGVGGYGPDQILIRMQDELEQLNPDLVILSIFSGNDFGDLIRNKLYTLKNDGSIAKNNFIISKEISKGFEIGRNEPISKKILRRIYNGFFHADKSVASQTEEDPNKKVEVYLQRNLNEYEEYIVHGDNTVRELTNDSYSADVSLMPKIESSEYKVALMSAVISEIKKLHVEKGYPLVGLIIPHPMDLLDGSHDSGFIDREKYSEYLPRYLTNTLQAIFDEQDIDRINLYTPYLEKDPASLYFIGGDDHWNDKGQRVAARIVADGLIKNNWLE